MTLAEAVKWCRQHNCAVRWTKAGVIVKVSERSGEKPDRHYGQDLIDAVESARKAGYA